MGLPGKISPWVTFCIYTSIFPEKVTNVSLQHPWRRWTIPPSLSFSAVFNKNISFLQLVKWLAITNKLYDFSYWEGTQQAFLPSSGLAIMSLSCQAGFEIEATPTYLKFRNPYYKYFCFIIRRLNYVNYSKKILPEMACNSLWNFLFYWLLPQRFILQIPFWDIPFCDTAN